MNDKKAYGNVSNTNEKKARTKQATIQFRCEMAGKIAGLNLPKKKGLDLPRG